jgi:hypothetical protein
MRDNTAAAVAAASMGGLLVPQGEAGPRDWPGAAHNESVAAWGGAAPLGNRQGDTEVLRGRCHGGGSSAAAVRRETR